MRAGVRLIPIPPATLGIVEREVHGARPGAVPLVADAWRGFGTTATQAGLASAWGLQSARGVGVQPPVVMGDIGLGLGQTDLAAGPQQNGPEASKSP